MAHVINDQCVSCGSCESECPVDAIKQGETIYEIDADNCIDCGVCVASCPTDAIVAEQSDKQHLSRQTKTAQYFEWFLFVLLFIFLFIGRCFFLAYLCLSL